MSDTERRDELAEYDESELVFHPDGTVTRKRFLIAGGGAVLGAAVSGPLIFTRSAEAMTDLRGIHLPYRAHTSVKGSLKFWHFWSSPLRRGAIHSAIKQFNSVYKHIQVEDLPIPFANMFDKIHTAVAAQSGVPDVVVADRPSFWVDARSRVYEPLTAYNARDKVSSRLFYPFTWYESNVKVHGKNELFGLPFETDIRVMFVNRAALIDAGLNPNHNPKAWDDLKKFAAKLDQKSGSQYSVMTFWPLDNQSLDTIVWENRGDWETRKQYPTVNSAHNIQTAEFIKYWVDRYGGESAFNYLNSQSQPGLDPFASSHLVLHVDTPTYQDATLNQHGVKFTPKNGSSNYPYWNVAEVPAGPSGKPYTFSGGFAMGVPRNDHRSHGNADAAWEFVKFMSLVGQLTFERFAGNIPTVIKMTHDSYLSSKPHWSSVTAALHYGHPKTRNTYDPLYPKDVTDTAQGHVVDGSQSPKDAMDAAQHQALLNMKRNGGP
ncbi:MAG: extracellular solute-binding protein [Chloroflexota bacterium]